MTRKQDESPSTFQMIVYVIIGAIITYGVLIIGLLALGGG